MEFDNPIVQAFLTHRENRFAGWAGWPRRLGARLAQNPLLAGVIGGVCGFQAARFLDGWMLLAIFALVMIPVAIKMVQLTKGHTVVTHRLPPGLMVTFSVPPKINVVIDLWLTRTRGRSFLEALMLEWRQGGISLAGFCFGALQGAALLMFMAYVAPARGYTLREAFRAFETVDLLAVPGLLLGGLALARYAWWAQATLAVRWSYALLEYYGPDKNPELDKRWKKTGSAWPLASVAAATMILMIGIAAAGMYAFGSRGGGVVAGQFGTMAPAVAASLGGLLVAAAAWWAGSRERARYDQVLGEALEAADQVMPGLVAVFTEKGEA